MDRQHNSYDQQRPVYSADVYEAEKRKRTIQTSKFLLRAALDAQYHEMVESQENPAVAPEALQAGSTRYARMAVHNAMHEATTRWPWAA